METRRDLCCGLTWVSFIHFIFNLLRNSIKCTFRAWYRSSTAMKNISYICLTSHPAIYRKVIELTSFNRISHGSQRSCRYLPTSEIRKLYAVTLVTNSILYNFFFFYKIQRIPNIPVKFRFNTWTPKTVPTRNGFLMMAEVAGGYSARPFLLICVYQDCQKTEIEVFVGQALYLKWIWVSFQI